MVIAQTHTIHSKKKLKKRFFIPSTNCIAGCKRPQSANTSKQKYISPVIRQKGESKENKAR